QQDLETERQSTHHGAWKRFDAREPIDGVLPPRDFQRRAAAEGGRVCHGSSLAVRPAFKEEWGARNHGATAVPPWARATGQPESTMSKWRRERLRLDRTLSRWPLLSAARR